MIHRLLAACLLLSLLPGCSRPKPPAPPSAPTESVWLVVSGDTDGNLDHCDCPLLKEGGLPVRAEMIRRMREKNPNLLLLDDGGNARARNLVERMKTEITWRAMHVMDYDAVLVSNDDLSEGFATLLPASREQHIPFVVANMRLTYGKGQGAWQKQRIVRRGGLTFGITGVAGEAYSDLAVPYALEDPVVALRREVAAMRDLVDVVIALSDSVLPRTNERLARVPGVDVLVVRPGEWIDAEKAKRTATMVSFGEEGKALGRVGIDRRAGRTVVGEPQMLPVVSSATEDFQVRVMVDDIYRTYLNQPGMEAAAAGLLVHRPLESDTSNPYLGYQACISCHTSEYDQWKETPHARAYATLVAKKRQLDSECAVCHVTGFGRVDGFHIKVAGDPLANVQCEACHGPGGKHAAVPKKDNIRLGSRDICETCHVARWTPDFDKKFADYWKRTIHKSSGGSS